MTSKLVNQEFQWVARIKKHIIFRILKRLSLEKYIEKLLPSPRDILLKRIPKNATCVEIGVWTGEFTQRILNVANPKKIYLIDPWLAYDDYYEIDYNLSKYTQTSQDNRYKSVLKRFHKEIKQGKIEVIRDISSNVIKGLLKDKKYDFVYIDGNHSYEYVLEDLKNYLPNLEKNGFFGIDDYNFESVRKAVQDFCILSKPRFTELLKYDQYFIKP